ncbi:CBS domain-containing protein [Mycolicibacterium cosmeticum]|uniref:Signal-transduction protein containing cAMP-binding and CBS domains n=1 Tax=Mycolicibacterium cosmeticum TaxID=258533 RepID=W9AT36_MYCCO|nr:CBS domain-containing protein [Mycolicibacterium cosmeticum]TLH72705.1 CBS domain-containing protein [Mycolicibacterium cosmeticum]CDO05771.1 putative signal-transduction protein containing cAMP-binding and CBS domains [Mycolicibacterium cosmeticum]
MRISDVLKSKGATVATIAPDTAVADLLAGLVGRNIGAMVVVGPDGPVGIVSERDVVHKLHELGADLLQRPVSDIMTKHLVYCSPTDSVDSLSAVMTHNRVRHIPVLDGGRLAGIVSIGDVVKTRMQELESQQEQLQAYITQG